MLRLYLRHSEVGGVSLSHLSGTQDVLQNLGGLWPFLHVLVQQEVLPSPFNDLTQEQKVQALNHAR